MLNLGFMSHFWVFESIFYSFFFFYLVSTDINSSFWLPFLLELWGENIVRYLLNAYGNDGSNVWPSVPSQTRERSKELREENRRSVKVEEKKSNHVSFPALSRSSLLFFPHSTFAFECSFFSFVLNSLDSCPFYFFFPALSFFFSSSFSLPHFSQLLVGQIVQ